MNEVSIIINGVKYDAVDTCSISHCNQCDFIDICPASYPHLCEIFKIGNLRVFKKSDKKFEP